jgi:hypothetical protein
MGSARRSSLVVLLASLIVPILFVGLATPSVHATGVLLISPSNRPAQAVGSTLSYQAEVFGMDQFNAWDIIVRTDPSVLTAISISVSNNMFGSVFEVANCVEGVGSGCSIRDGAGVAHSAAASSTGASMGGNGLLFTVTYRVKGSGYSFLTLPSGLDIIANSGATVSHSDSNGVYGNPPVVPIASFTFSPAPPANITQGVDNVTFDASLSTDPAGGTITNYAWEITPVSGGYLDIKASTSQPIWLHQFNGTYEVGDLVVTLIVTDNLSPPKSSQPFSQLITVQEKPNPSLIVSAIRASPQDNIISGTPVSITATVFNKGNILEHGFNLTIFLDGRVFKTVNSTVAISRGRTIDSTFTLNTTGLKPNTYDIVGVIQPSHDPNSSGFLTIRIVDPYLGASIPFTVPEFLGLIIATLVGIGVVRFLVNRSRLRRRLLEMELS